MGRPHVGSGRSSGPRTAPNFCQVLRNLCGQFPAVRSESTIRVTANAGCHRRHVHGSNCLTMNFNGGRAVLNPPRKNRLP